MKQTGKENKNRFIDTENKWVIAKGEGFGGVCEIGEQKISSYK